MVRFGEYELGSRLAKGGMAEIHRAVHLPTDSEVVIKRLLPEMKSRDDIVDLFLTEADVGGLLDHENIVKVLDAGETEGDYFIAMEFIDGCDAEALLEHSWSNKHALPVPLVCRIGVDSLRGLHHAHTLKTAQGKSFGLIHRDISPDNLFITKSGITKVADFGIAKLSAIEGSTQTGLIKGKLSYMSPEQVQGQELDGRTDAFSMALVLFEMLASVRPFARKEGESEIDNLMRVRTGKVPNVRRSEPKVPKAVAKTIDKALRRWRSFRFSDCGAFADALEAAARIDNVLASREDLGEHVTSIVTKDK